MGNGTEENNTENEQRSIYEQLVEGDLRVVGNKVIIEGKGPDALKNILDSNLIGGALATSLTKQLSIEFDKDGGFIKQLLGSPVKAVGGVLATLADKIETYNIAIINSARELSRASGGLITDTEALESVRRVRQEVGGSLAQLGATPDEVIKNIKETRGLTGDFVRFLSDSKTVTSLAAFRTQIQKLGGVDMTKLNLVFRDLDEKSGKQVVERIKQITGAAVALSDKGVLLPDALNITFEAVSKLADKGNMSFNQLLKTTERTIETQRKFGAEIPEVLNNVLPSFNEVFGITRRLGVILRGETIDPKRFMNLRGPERFESIFQAFRRAQATGRFQIEPEGIGREQQIVQITRALQGAGLKTGDVATIIRNLEKGTPRITATLDSERDPRKIDAELQKRIKDTLSLEDTRLRPTRQAAEDQALTADGPRRFGRIIDDISMEITDFLEKRGKQFFAISEALGKNSLAFLNLTQVIQAFTGFEGDPGKEGLIAFSLLGPPGTFTKTTEKMKELSKILEPIFKGIAGISKENPTGRIGGEIVDPNNPVLRAALEQLQKLKESQEQGLKIIKEEYDQELEKLREEIKKLKDARKAANPGGGGSGADASGVLKVQVVNPRDIASASLSRNLVGEGV